MPIKDNIKNKIVTNQKVRYNENGENMKKKKIEYGDRWFYRLIKPLLIFLIYTLYRPTVVGRENIPKEGPLVLAGNHTKWLDPETLCAVVRRRQVHFLAKIELFKGPSHIITWGMGAIPVNRKIHDHGALDYAIEALKNGLCIGIFPEGTINRTDDVIMPFKIGAVKMSKEANATLVPFAITGEYKLFRKGIKIEFLKPIEVEDDLNKTNQKLMDAVSKKLIEGGRTHGTKRK